MIRLYCTGHHYSKNGLCEDCLKLLDYTLVRIDKCVFGSDKPVLQISVSDHLIRSILLEMVISSTLSRQ